MRGFISQLDRLLVRSPAFSMMGDMEGGIRARGGGHGDTRVVVPELTGILVSFCTGIFSA